jgi:Suppressor of fused protein (SUFU)
MSSLQAHYEAFWGPGTRKRFDRGPVADLGEFSILYFGPSPRTSNRIYATDGMSHGLGKIELHVVSPVSDDGLVELLTVVAHYNLTTPVGLGHTVNLGRPWLPQSACSFGLISRPYRDGPKLENIVIDDEAVACLWLVPITARERDFKIANGLEALEHRFDAAKLDYANPRRASAV